MTVGFVEAVDRISACAGRAQPGKRALSTQHRAVVDADGGELYGSLNLDEALAASAPNENRWDYAVAHACVEADGQYITWIEVHPATPGKVKDILDKRSALDAWLDTEGKPLRGFPCCHVWIASGGVGLPLNSPERRKLALRRIKGPCKHYKLRRGQCS